MSDFLTAVALAVVIEGMLYALLPSVMRRGAEVMLRTPDNALRVTGVVLAAIGVAGVWLIRG